MSNATLIVLVKLLKKFKSVLNCLFLDFRFILIIDDNVNPLFSELFGASLTLVNITEPTAFLFLILFLHIAHLLGDVLHLLINCEIVGKHSMIDTANSFFLALIATVAFKLSILQISEFEDVGEPVTEVVKSVDNLEVCHPLVDFLHFLILRSRLVSNGCINEVFQ